MNKKFLMAVIITLAVAGNSSAQSGIKVQPGQSHSISYADQARLWLTTPWTGDSTPYRHITSEVDAALKNGTTPLAVDKIYRDRAQASPLDPKAQFAWAFINQKLFELRQGVQDPIILEKLAQVDPTNVYEFERVRFLLIQEVTPNEHHPDLKNMGERLLARNPQDEIVRTNLIYLLTGYRQGLPDALHLAQDQVNRNPDDAVDHASLAFVYQRMLSCSHGQDQSARAHAIAEYKEYLRLASPNDYYRPRATLTISSLQTQKKW